jgi:hypothetical protein
VFIEMVGGAVLKRPGDWVLGSPSLAAHGSQVDRDGELGASARRKRSSSGARVSASKLDGAGAGARGASRGRGHVAEGAGRRRSYPGRRCGTTASRGSEGLEGGRDPALRGGISTAACLLRQRET